MERRVFLAGLLCAAALPARPALAQQDGDWAMFDKLAKAFDALLRAADPIAETVTRAKFRRFLRRIRGTVARIIKRKEAVFMMLQHPTCAASASLGRLPAALAAAQEIIPLVRDLAGHVETLADAVRPVGTSSEIRDIADGLRGMQARKMWVNLIDDYCRWPPDRRTGFRGEVRASLAVVQRCERQLDALIDRLA